MAERKGVIVDGSGCPLAPLNITQMHDRE